MATKIATASARADSSAGENAPNASGASGAGGGKRGGGKGGKAGKNRGQTPAQGQGQQRDKEKGKAKVPPQWAEWAPTQEQQKSEEVGASPLPSTEAGADAGAGTEGGGTEEVVCWICAEPVKYYSVSACNHRTCHVCALRLRALYKRLDCTFCKEPQQAVVFTTSSESPFAEYDLEGMIRDDKLSIYFETQEMMEETLILLRFNCPDPDCEYIGNGWGDVKLHTRAVHNRLLCDLCVRNKKVFSHEHALYPPNVLPVHLPSMHQRHRHNIPKDQVEGGVHPMCGLCHECFFDNDELYTHCRERHEECFICKRNDIRNQYFQDYSNLEQHFHEAHYPCTQSQCLARKFVVFGTPLDLKAHIVEEHGGDMNSKDRRDARRVVADFAFEDAGGRHGHGRRDHHEREREREPPPPPRRPPSPPMPRPQPTGQSRRREAFGARLTVDGVPTGESAGSSSQATLEANRMPTPGTDDVDPAVAERHSALISRLQSLATNPVAAVPAVKAAMRGYRASESSARDLISTIWNILDGNLEHTASIINAFVDLLEEEDKKQDLLASWKGFAIEQRRQFPELVPTAVGGNYAAIATGRVLNAKHSTKARSSQKSSRAVWDRVAQAASSSSSPSASTTSLNRFPALQAAPSSSGPTIRPPSQGQRTTPWTSSGASMIAGLGGSAPRPVETKIQVVPTIQRSSSTPSTKSQRPPKLSSAQFPELPSSSTARPKASVSGNSSLRNILGASAGPAVAAWQAGPSESVNVISSDFMGLDVADNDGGEAALVQEATGGQRKGKKSKGKQKQTLFTLGSFPT